MYYYTMLLLISDTIFVVVWLYQFKGYSMVNNIEHLCAPGIS